MSKLQLLLKRSGTVAVLALGIVAMFAVAAFATTDPQVTAVGTAINSAANNAKEVIVNNMPVVFGVAIAFIAWAVGRRVLGKI